MNQWHQTRTALAGDSHSMRRGTVRVGCAVVMGWAAVIGCLAVGMPPASASVPGEVGQRHLLLCCGLPGDDTHREMMTAAMKDIALSVEAVFEVPADRQTILVGDERMQQELESAVSISGISTSESVQAAISRLAESLSERDSLVVIFVGHSYLNGTASQFNVLDSDFSQTDFAAWCEPIKCREQVFILTQPLSGFWIRPLRRPNRMIITATEADLEFTGTEMPYALAEVLAGTSTHSELKDIDGDGQLSLLDLYLAVNLEIDGRFTAMERLQTEHAQLEDNGDGRGSEVQTPYLPVKLEEDSDDEPAEDTDDETADDEDADDEDADSEDADSEAADNGATETDTKTPPEQEPPPAVTAASRELAKPPIIRASNLDGYRSRFVRLKPSPPRPAEAPSTDAPSTDTAPTDTAPTDTAPAAAASEEETTNESPDQES